jgi:hypothetical protein
MGARLTTTSGAYWDISNDWTCLRVTKKDGTYYDLNRWDGNRYVRFTYTQGTYINILLYSPPIITSIYYSTVIWYSQEYGTVEIGLVAGVTVANAELSPGSLYADYVDSLSWSGNQVFVVMRNPWYLFWESGVDNWYIPVDVDITTTDGRTGTAVARLVVRFK